MISSIGLNGSGYRQYKSGPGELVSFAHTENLLVWATRLKGEDGGCASLARPAGGVARRRNRDLWALIPL